MYLAAALLLLWVQSSIANLITNGDFEHTNLASWNGNGGNIALYTMDSHKGNFSLRSFSRPLIDEGPCQFVEVHEGGYYTFKSYIKQLGDNAGTLLQSYTAAMKYSNSQTDYPIASRSFVQSKNGWLLMEGDFTPPKIGFKKAELCVYGPDKGIEFLLDDVSLESFQRESNWEANANARIQTLRKRNIDFIFRLDPGVVPSKVTVKIDHKRHLFGFGSFVDMNWIDDPRYAAYNNMTFNLFNWATLTSLGWASTQQTDVASTFHRQLGAAQLLHDKKVRVRGNTLFSRPPSWVQRLNSLGFQSAAFTRVTELLNASKGLIDQWDLLDNPLDNLFYEEKIGDPDYIKQLCDLMKLEDPSVLSYLNQDDVLAIGSKTHAYAELATSVKDHGLGGLGVKGSFPITPPDATLLKVRLDRIASAGLPVWITEMSVTHVDSTIRASLLDTALRMYFSHPTVEGVTFKSVWDSTLQSPTALFNGFDCKPNTAGQRFINLTQVEWSTHVTRSLKDGTQFTVNGFQGDYEIQTLYNGVPAGQTDLHLGQSDTIFMQHINVPKN